MALQSRSFSLTYEYDVFLSFRGSDTRYGFTGNLYKALHDKGIHAFIDDQHLQRGDQITPALVKAIQESRIAIIVLSNNYATSSFCLDELTIILDCAKTKRLLVFPVFYDVDPSELRHQRGSYGEALAQHEEKFKAKKESFNHNMERLEKWKMALHQVANLSGYHFKQGNRAGYESKFIGSIVDFVSSKINRAPLHVAHYPVGLQSRVLEVRKLLDLGSDAGVLVIGIHGIGGIGKSTLARAVYNLIAGNFVGSCYLENIREKSEKHGLEHIQSILLSELLGEKEIKLSSVPQGISTIKHRLKRKKVLLILDDVDTHQQLQDIVGKPDWFGPGSRVIITTRDKQLLASLEVKGIYEVKELDKKDALQLLKWNAFKTEEIDPSYLEVMNQVVTYASGLPLALEVIGSNLVRKSTEEWKSACKKYKRIPNSKILEILKVSFDGLDEEEKSVFLDIACCLKGDKLIEIEDILRAHYGYCIKYHIGVLVQKSLIKHVYNDTITLHDLIEDMGKEIVRQESPEEPWQRSRLWELKDIIEVFENNTETGKTKMMCLNYPSDKERIDCNGGAFEKMKKLKTLIIRNGKFSKVPRYLPNSLRVLVWWGYPSHCLPPDFHPKNLAICKLPNSCFTSSEIFDPSKEGLQWLNEEGEEKVGSIVSSKIEIFSVPAAKLYDDFFSIGFTKRLAHVKELYLSNNNFTILPECIKEFQFLWKLNVSDCKHLREIRGIPPSLNHFDAQNCISLACSSANIFLKKELHEAGNTFICLPEERIPEWFDHHSRGSSISFWFRNKFPDKILCLVIGHADYRELRDYNPEVLINGYSSTSRSGSTLLFFQAGCYHTYLFDLRELKFENIPYEEHFGNEWNHVEVTFERNYGIYGECGIHIFKQESCMEDVRFTDPYDPYGKRKLDNNLNSLESQNPPRWNKFCTTLHDWMRWNLDNQTSIDDVDLYIQFGIIKELNRRWRIEELMYSNKWEVNSGVLAKKNRLLQDIRRAHKDLETFSTSFATKPMKPVSDWLTCNRKEWLGSFLRKRDGWANVYCDGAVSYANQKAVCAAVITIHVDGHGYVAGFAKDLQFMSALQAQLWGVFYGIRLAIAKGFSNLDIYSDSMEAVIMLHSGNFPPPLSHLGQHINSLVENLQHVRYCRILWDLNIVAYLFSKHGLSVDNDVCFFDSPPSASSPFSSSKKKKEKKNTSW